MSPYYEDDRDPGNDAPRSAISGSGEGDAELAEQERVDVHVLLDALAARGTDAVAALGAGAQEDGTGAAARLQAGSHLARLHRIDARVVGAGHEQHRWVGDAPAAPVV